MKNLENRTASEATSFSEIKKWIELAQTKNKLLEISLTKNTSLSNLKTGSSFDKESKHFSPEMKKRSSNKLNEREKYDELIKPLFKVYIFFYLLRKQIFFLSYFYHIISKISNI